MPRGSRRTSYVRDTRGRFASTPGGGAPKRPPAKKASRGTNRLTRDNSGRITSVGGNGATARGGRLRTGAGNLRARQTDRLKRAPLQGVVSRGGEARAGAAKKPAGWMQSPEARKDRVQQAAHRKGYAKKLRALPKTARRAIQIERMNYGASTGNRMRSMRDIAEGRVILIGNAGKRKDKLSPGRIDAIAQTMNRSARRLKAGMVTARRGRMKYNPNAVEASGRGTAARKIRGARVGGVARRVRPRAAKPQTFNDTLKKANPAAYEKLQKREAKVAKAQQRKADKLASRNGASAPTGTADARGRRSARLSGVSGRIAGRARRVYAQQGERVGAGGLPNRGLFAAPMGRRSTGTNAATSGLQPGRKARGARLSGTIAKPKGLKPGAIKPKSKPATPRGPATSRLRPGELMNANARPVGTIAKPKRASDAFKKTKRENLAIAEAIIKRNGFTSYVDTRRSANGVASTSPIRPGKITLVKNSEYWANPAKNSIDQRRQGFWSSSNPAAVIYHEIGHTRAKRTGFINDSSKAWGIGVRPFSNPRNQALARRVGQYATTSPSEFVAEVYAGLRTGRRYDFQVMRAYREEAGFPAASPRRRSRLRRKP